MAHRKGKQKAHIFKGLKKDWFVKNSIRKTLENIIHASDKAYLCRISRAKFVELLKHELKFLCCYTPKELSEVDRYIDEYLDELYQLVKK